MFFTLSLLDRYIFDGVFFPFKGEEGISVHRETMVRIFFPEDMNQSKTIQWCTYSISFSFILRYSFSSCSQECMTGRLNSHRSGEMFFKFKGKCYKFNGILICIRTWFRNNLTNSNINDVFPLQVVPENVNISTFPQFSFLNKNITPYSFGISMSITCTFQGS